MRCIARLTAILAATTGVAFALPPGGGTAALSPTSGPEQSATAPEQSPPLMTEAQLAPLVTICRKLNQRQWADPIIETFDKAPAKDQQIWNSGQGGILDYKDGKLIVTGNGFVVAYRTLPKEMKNSEAVRIDAWVQIHPMNWPNRPAPILRFHNIMFLGGDPNAIQQWDYQFWFATGTGDLIHFLAKDGGFSGQPVTVDAVKPGKLMHLIMELAPRRYTCQRDGNAPLTGQIPISVPLRVTADMPIGFSSQIAGRFAIVKVVYRWVPPAKDANIDQEMRVTPFKTQEALTQFLAERVVPRLDDPQYQPRAAATGLLRSLWPLSAPAVQAAQPGFSPEGQARLAQFKDYVAPLEFTMPSTRPDEAVKPPVTKDLPAEVAADGDKKNEK